MKDLDETQLVRKCEAGDEAAWREFVRRFERVVFAVSFRILKDYDEARDATQDSLLRAMRGLGTFRQEQQLKPWICRIAWNHALRLAAKRHKQLISLQERAPAQEWSPLPDPAELTEHQETRRVLEKALETLPVAMQLVLELRCSEGMDYREIAEATGWPIGTVKTNLFRGRKLLIERLASMGAES